jgi:hypothetical protein
MNGGGFVLIRRALLEHPAFRNELEAMQFAWLIARAAWKPTRVRYKDKAIHLKRGQLAISVRDMAAKLGLSIGAIQRFINRLKIDSMVDTHADSGVMVITICNYSLYQDVPTGADSPSDTATGTEPIQSRFTEQQRKQVKQDSPLSPPKGQGTRTYLPDDWKPPPIAGLPPKAQEAAKQWPRPAYEAQAESFALYWQSERKMKVDWQKTWANWIHRAHWRVMQDARRQPARDGNGDGKKIYQRMAEERAGRA